MKHPRPRTTCALCQKSVAIHSDHTLWPHTKGLYSARCEASEHHPDWRPAPFETTEQAIDYLDARDARNLNPENWRR